MRKIALIYGGIAGVITIISMVIGFMVSDGEGFGSSQIIGYLFMIVALSMIFFGIKSYRDNHMGGVIGFRPAIKLGLGIALVAGIAYVISWEIYLALTDHQFIETYTANVIEAKQAAGMAGAELDAFVQKMDEMKANYAKPLYRMPLTFLEIFPLAAIISLISSAILKNPKVLAKHG